MVFENSQLFNPAPIPRQFHFVFGLRPQTEPFHLVYYLCLESCIRVNQPEKVYFHYHFEPHGRYWDLVKDQITLKKVEPVDLVSRFQYEDKYIQQYFTYAHHADFIRLEALLEAGGIYADIDTLFINPYPPSLYRQSFVLGREDPIRCHKSGAVSKSLCNALILSQRGAKFGRRWLDEMPAAFDGTWSNHSTILPQRLSEELPDLIHIEPPRSFYGFMWTRQDLRRLFEEREVNLEGMYSIHLWSHLWWSRNRHDFSDFHAELLTEEYIRSTDTTYNIAARPYLPAAQGSLHAISSRRGQQNCGNNDEDSVVQSVNPGKDDQEAYWEQRLGRSFNHAGTGMLAYGNAFNWWLYRIYSSRFRQVIRSLGIDIPGSEILDVGSGTGFYVGQWLRLGAKRVTGIDFSGTATARASARFPNCNFIRADIGGVNNPVPSNRFQLVSAFAVLFHIVDDARYRNALKNIADAMTPGGYFVFSDNFVHRPRPAWGNYHVSRTLAAITAAIEDSGLSVVDRVPLSILGGDPVDSSNSWLQWYWRGLSWLVTRSNIAGACAGGLLYPMEIALTRIFREGPSTEIMICRKL